MGYSPKKLNGFVRFGKMAKRLLGGGGNLPLLPPPPCGRLCEQYYNIVIGLSIFTIHHLISLLE